MEGENSFSSVNLIEGGPRLSGVKSPSILLSDDDYNFSALLESLTDGQAELYNVDENCLIEELERLAMCLDCASMTLEDYRAHELRRETGQISISCATNDIETAQSVLAQAVQNNNFPVKLRLGTHSLILKVAEPEKTPEVSPIQATPPPINKERLKFYNATIKQAKLQLLKDKESLDNERKKFANELTQLKSTAKEFSFQMQSVRKKVTNFVERLLILSEFYSPDTLTESSKTPTELSAQISALESVSTTLAGQQKEKVLMQINRLKTQQATLRVQAVLAKCPQPTSAKSPLLNSDSPLKTPFELGKRRKSMHARNLTADSMKSESFEADKVYQELQIMRARLEEKLDELNERGVYLLKRANIPKGSEDHQLSLYCLERRLIKAQEDIDKQKLTLAAKVRNQQRAQDELDSQKDTFHSLVLRAIEDARNLIEYLE